MSQQGEGPWHISSPRVLSPWSETTDLCALYRWRRCSEGGGEGEGGREGGEGGRGRGEGGRKGESEDKGEIEKERRSEMFKKI